MDEIEQEIVEDIAAWEHLVEFVSSIHWGFYFVLFAVIFIIVVAIRDILNRKQTIKHNFPVVGHFRYLLEKIGPELRQYIVANNREELPFNRSERSWIYASSKRQNNYQGFGTDKEITKPGYIFINPAMFAFRVTEKHINHPLHDPYFLPSPKIMGIASGRRKPYRPYSVINISAMSFGSLSARAVESLNRGAAKAGCYHNTGEGSLSPYHQHGADIVFHFGTGYFGCRNEDGSFSLDKLTRLTEKHPEIKAIEIKLSQGAKPGKGGVLPASKITAEIAQIRDLPMGKDILSPAYHSAFSNVPELVDFVESIAEATGLPVGIKSAVGKLDQWHELAHIMKETNRGPDFIAIDGGEGGTGASPPSFADHVSLPWVYGFSQVYQVFSENNLSQRVVWVGAGKLGLPANALMAMAMGADLVNVAREAMMSIGCIQAQVCHTNTCPAGIATQNKWLQSGVDPFYKSERFFNYARTFRKELLEITHACGYEHPTQLTMSDIDVSMGDNNHTQTLKQVYGYEKDPVPYVSMVDLYNCPHLGGLKKENMTHEYVS
jgi:glutamate synthase domain-containing protein 2